MSFVKKPIYVAEELKSQDINTDNIYFVDTSSHREGPDLTDKKIFHVYSPSHFNDLYIAIQWAFNQGVQDIVLDSISTLLAQGTSSVVQEFIENLITIARKTKKGIYFTVLEEDKNNVVISRISNLFDKVTELKELTSDAREEALTLVESLLGPNAALSLRSSTHESDPKLMVKEFKSILSKLIGPENAAKQVKEIYQKYVG